MLTELNKDRLENLLQTLNGLPPPLNGVTESSGLSQILRRGGVPAPLAENIETSLTQGHFDLPTLKSAIGYASYQKLVDLRNLCLGVVGLGFFFIVVSLFLMSGRTMVIWIGGIIWGAMKASAISNEMKSFQGRKKDLQTVEKHSQQQKEHSAPPDLY